LVADGREVYKRVAEYAANDWNYNKNILLVIGATFPEELGAVRKICPNIPFLVPGIGAQGGSVKKVMENGKDSKGAGLVINSSRGIIYSSSDSDFAEAAREATIKLNDNINQYR
jgi:orotidine-5'-phosphate decarboxylase